MIRNRIHETLQHLKILAASELGPEFKITTLIGSRIILVAMLVGSQIILGATLIGSRIFIGTTLVGS
jgi:hypothetical protein